jgi:transcriptional regulator with XRE-family HTH domain
MNDSPDTTDEGRLMRQVGQRLDWVLELAGLSQTAAAGLLGVTQGELSRWITGTRMARLIPMMEFCQRFRVSLDYIYRGHLLGCHPDLARELIKRHPGKLVPPPIYTGWGTGTDLT